MKVNESSWDREWKLQSEEIKMFPENVHESSREKRSEAPGRNKRSSWETKHQWSSRGKYTKATAKRHEVDPDETYEKAWKNKQKIPDDKQLLYNEQKKSRLENKNSNGTITMKTII